MKVAAKSLALLLLAVILPPLLHGQISSFQHVVVIFQENRTPDNLFQALCGPTGSQCPSPYNLRNFGFNSKGQKIFLTPTTLGTDYDLGHKHSSFVKMCDLDPITNQCQMDGADQIHCGPVARCPLNPQFQFVQAADIGPYLTIAQQYGWANFMFQTNQGPSTPAHQFIFAGTSAPSAIDDANATFIAENPSAGGGCLAHLNSVAHLINPASAPKEVALVNNPQGTLCFSQPTMASLLDGIGKTWKYYTPGTGIWNAATWIKSICVPNADFTQCTGMEWNNSVDLTPKHVLTDIGACQLANVSWVIPSLANSDHAGGNKIGGPSWVASIVNAIGSSTACDSGTGYWKNTALIITWDDWGGWYDHEPPTLLSAPNAGQGDYE